MLVTRSNFDEVLSTLSKKCTLSLDTETTGLRPFHGDRLFSIQIAVSKDESYYFNFYIYSDSTPDTVLPKSYLGAMQMKLFSDRTKIWFMHNAKFDLLMLEKEGMHLEGRVYCTMINARVLKNDSTTFSLKDLSKPLGFEKSDEVEKYIADHGLWSWEKLPGKKVRVKNKFFVKVPFDTMLRYGEQDAKVTHELGTRQLEGISKLSRKVQDSSKLLKPLTDIMELERKILSVTCDMQMQGIQLDKEYTLKAIDYEAARLSEAKKEFKKLTGSDFKQSSKFLSKIFEEQKDKWSYTEKGQPSFTDRALNRLTGPVVETIRSMRDATSKHQFYHSFLYEADQEGIVHPTLQQSGTVTGRFSATAPNLLAITKEEEEGEWKVRRAFVPRPGYRFVSMDFKQMEYILMLRYARESKLIEAVKAGVDLHEETGKLMGVDRKHAKCMHPQTLVVHNNQIKYLGDISSNREKDTFSEATGVIFNGSENISINAFYSNGEDEGVVIYSTRGIIKCSKNHKIKMLSGELKRAEEIKEGDALFYNENPLPKLEESDTVDYNFFGNKLRLNKDFCYFVGLVLGDGCINDTSISMACDGNNALWLQSIRDSLDKVGIKFNSGKNKHAYYLGSRRVIEVFDKLGLVDNVTTKNGKRKGLRIPKEIFNSSIENRYSFLAGLIDTDGTVAKDSGSVSITTKSDTFANEIIFLAASVGVRCSLEYCWNKVYLKYYYRVKFWKNDSYAFCEEYLRHPQKRALLRKAKHAPNVKSGVALVKKILFERIPLVDLNINSSDHLYLANNFVTHNTLNFSILYGSGAAHLSEGLGCSYDEAKEAKAKYFARLPKVQQFIRSVMGTAKSRGYIVNMFGRVYRFPDPETAYKAPNALIQGSGADILKTAMVRIHELLRGTKSRMILCIHDDIVCEVHDSEDYLVPKIREIMESVVSNDPIGLKVDPSESRRSWGDLEKI